MAGVLVSADTHDHKMAMGAWCKIATCACDDKGKSPVVVPTYSAREASVWWVRLYHILAECPRTPKEG